MAGEGEDSMMDWDCSFFVIEPQYFDSEGQLIDAIYCPSTNPFVTPSEPQCDRFDLIAKTEPVQEAIASGSSAALESAELVSTSNVESCAALELQAKQRRATPSFFDDCNSSLGAKELVTDSSKGKERRERCANWSNDEKEAFLRLKLEALENSERSWFRFVSEQLWRRREIVRADQSCQQQWDSLYKAYKAIRHLHDLMNSSQSSQEPQMHPGVLFWDMEESARMDKKKKWNEELKYLPGTFPKEWYDLMEKIIFLQQGLKKSQDIKAMNHVGEFNREPLTTTSTATRDHAASWPGALDSSIIPPWNQPSWQLGNSSSSSSSSAVLCHESFMKQPSNDKIILPDDEELMSRITLLIDKQIEQALIMPELLRREEDNEQKYRENLHVREAEHQQRLQTIDAEHSQRLLAIEAEHSRRLQAIEAEHLRRLQAIEAEFFRRVEEVEQKHRKSLLDMLDEEELAASLKLTTIEARKRELA